MNALKQYHPVVGFSFFLLMIVMSLASMHPVFQCMSFVAVVGYALWISGPQAFVKGNWWVALLIVVVMLFNSIFGGRGLTVLMQLNLGFMQTQVTAEGLFYGFIMGLMLANVILWFNVLGKVSSMQGFIELFAGVSPTAGMMLARITVFIPELLAQAKLVDRAQNTLLSRKAVGAYGDTPQEADSIKRQQRKGQIAYASALSSHLMEWGMEKSLITANSMVARGYGSRKRTSYRRTQLTLRDVVPLVIILVLGAASLVCSIWAGVEYSYYPYLDSLELWWGYIPFFLLCLVLVALQIREELAWWQSR